MTYRVWDTETSIRESFKRKANPFDPENKVVMQGHKAKGGKVIGEYYGRHGPLTNPNWFINLLDGCKILVGQNIKFDLLYALREPANRLAWMKWVAAGGLVWDCQLVEYLLEGMDPASHMLSLDELAPKYGGNIKFDEVKALWADGVETADIPRDLLERYLLGTDDDHGDIGNTEAVFLGQLARARGAGQLKSIYMNMGSLICSTEMELNGMAVDTELGYKLAEELAVEIAALSVELNAHLPKDLPFEFKWGSTLQKSAIIFGGTVKYQKWVHHHDEEGNPLYVQKDEEHVCLTNGDTMSLEVWEQALLDGGAELPEAIRFKSGKNAGELKTKKVKVPDLTKPKGAQKDHFYEFPRLAEPKKKWAGATEGVWSTAADVIEELANTGVPFLKLLAKVSSLTKDMTTYYITTDPKTGEKKGMLTLVQADGIIHHMLNHTATVTGRFSSSNPNLQNLPKEGKSVAKSMFVSRFGEDGKIIQSDWKSLEVYIQAILTGCKQLIADLLGGLDMHCVRVSQAKGITYDEALRLCVTEKVKEWVKARNGAKVFSFQRAYGAGNALIAETTGLPREDVDALALAENERYPEIEPFFEALTQHLKNTRIPLANKWFQHPDIPGLSCNPGMATWRTPDGKLYSWRENATPEFLAKKGIPTSFSPTEIKNYPVQGTGGEWAKAAMWLAIRAYYHLQNFGGKALLVNQVHDAMYTDAHKDVALKAAALLHACMEETSTFMEWYFGWEIPVAVPSDTSWGANMMDEQKMPEGFNALVQSYRAAVRKMYCGNHQPTCEQTRLAA